MGESFLKDITRITLRFGRDCSVGDLYATFGAIAACSEERMACCLMHHCGDWSRTVPENPLDDEAMYRGKPVHSTFPIDPARPSSGLDGNTLWIITSKDRSITTFLLPEEY